MSLKAKLEAVIYAADEPVTLGQLALLFTADVLEWKAEQEAASAAAQAEENERSEEGGEPLPLLGGGANYAEQDENGADIDAGEAAPEVLAEAKDGAEPVAEGGSEGGAKVTAMEAAGVEGGEAPAVEAVPGTGSGGEDAAAESGQEAGAGESDLKREARQRDREVRNVLRELLNELIAEYAGDERGIEIREVAGGYRMATKPECHDAVRGFIKSQKPPLKLSLPALETLAVIAYKQPVTAPEVNEIRGVDSSGVFGSLLSRKLIATAGRKQVVGRPILYKTTREFLLRFGLKDVSELPSMEEFEKMAAMELEEAEGEAGARAQPELDEAASEEDAPEAAGGASNETGPAVAAPENAGQESGEPEAKAFEAGEPAENEQIPHE